MVRLFLLIGAAVFISPALAQHEVIGSGSSVQMPDKQQVKSNVAWTLESATRRVLEVAPERRQYDAAVEAREEELIQAGKWPNPSIDLRADNRIGQMSGGGGIGFAQSSLSQPLPIRRIARQQAAAELNLAATQSARSAQFLLLEREAARVFHALQLAKAKRQLAQEQMGLTDQFAAGKMAVSGDHLRRYLTPLEQGRLAILREDARQLLIAAQRDQESAQIEFRNLLGLAGPSEAETTPPTQPSSPPPLEDMERNLERHPAVEAARREMDAAEKGIEVAESQRYADPVLKLFRDRDFNNGVFNVTGVGVSFEIPLWSRNRSLEASARAEAETSRTHYEVLRRDTRTHLEQAHAQLVQLQKETGQWHARLVEPARKILDLTRRGFAAGESNVLALVDANNAYFDARSRYLDLLNRYALAAADLRVAAGKSVLDQKESLP